METKKANTFLDNLRKSGTVNMFQAPKILEEVFNIKKKDARLLVANWMSSKERE